MEHRLKRTRVCETHMSVQSKTDQELRSGFIQLLPWRLPSSKAFCISLVVLLVEIALGERWRGRGFSRFSAAYECLVDAHVRCYALLLRQMLTRGLTSSSRVRPQVTAGEREVTPLPCFRFHCWRC